MSEENEIDLDLYYLNEEKKRYMIDFMKCSTTRFPKIQIFEKPTYKHLQHTTTTVSYVKSSSYSYNVTIFETGLFGFICAVSKMHTP